MQTKKQSAVEVVVGMLIGIVVALCAQIVIFPLLGLEVDFNTNIKIVLIFTVISLVRGYLVRRMFNYLHRPKQKEDIIMSMVQDSNPTTITEQIAGIQPMQESTSEIFELKVDDSSDELMYYEKQPIRGELT